MYKKAVKTQFINNQTKDKWCQMFPLFTYKLNLRLVFTNLIMLPLTYYLRHELIFFHNNKYYMHFKIQ